MLHTKAYINNTLETILLNGLLYFDSFVHMYAFKELTLVVKQKPVSKYCQAVAILQAIKQYIYPV